MIWVLLVALLGAYVVYAWIGIQSRKAPDRQQPW